MSIMEWYLKESGGDLATYHKGLSKGHQVGQAFFNALSQEDKERLRGTAYDPFWYQTVAAAEKAIDFLTGPDYTAKRTPSIIPNQRQGSALERKDQP